MSLPNPVGKQKEVLYLPPEGHVAVLGTAGSGKTTLAILRAAYLSDPDTPHGGKVLLVTFNRALVTYLKYLQANNLRNVAVENYHLFARGYLASRGCMPSNGILDSDQREGLVAKAISCMEENSNSPLLQARPHEFFSEELRWIAQHGITSASEYRDVERIGRAGARIQRKDRDLIFQIYEQYKSLRTELGCKYDWDDLATKVCDEFDTDTSPRYYKHIVIDEGQDFSPEMIRSLAKAIPSDGSLTFFGDVAQQIYGHRMSWRSAGLKIDKVWNFEQNYRNSQQIARLGLAISEMPYFEGVADLVEPVEPVAAGPLPTVIQFTSQASEIDFVVDQAKKGATNLSIAILFRDREDEKLVEYLLPSNKTRLHRKLNFWRGGPGIYYGTYHSAKGLEFDMVILPFCNQERLPEPGLAAAFGEKEAMRQDGRLLYVGVTRAKTRLLITFTGQITSMLPEDDRLYRRLS